MAEHIPNVKPIRAHQCGRLRLDEPPEWLGDLDAYPEPALIGSRYVPPWRIGGE